MDYGLKTGKLNFIKSSLKLDTEKLCGIKTNVKEFAKKHYRKIGSSIVVGALCFACTASLIDKSIAKHEDTGVMVSISDVSAGREAFDGDTFGRAGTTYYQMLTVNYESEKLAQLEKSEQQIEAILASARTDRKEQAALNELTADNAAETPSTAPATVVAAPSVEPTYADENGVYSYQGEFTLTGYCACPICCGAWSNMENPITASGAPAIAGITIAADTSIYPFGTQLVINGCVYTVQDRGGAVKGNHIDIFFSTHEAALQFGRQYGSVYLKLQ